MTMPDLTEVRRWRDQILLLASDHGVSNIRVLGPEAGPDAGRTADQGTDLDLLVDLERGRGALALFGFAQAVEDLVGRHVNIGTVLDARAEPDITVVAL